VFFPGYLDVPPSPPALVIVTASLGNQEINTFLSPFYKRGNEVRALIMLRQVLYL
jgi:hypothetical protein